VPDMRNVIPFTPLASTRNLSASNTLKRKKAENASSNNQVFSFTPSNFINPDEVDPIGYGVERCLYEFNPELACLSPHLIHAAALTPMEALVALETVATQPNRPSFPIDRHLAAFLISRWKEASLIDLQDIENPQREIKSLATLKILARLQEHYKINELPHLCQWMAEVCAPMITNYHSLNIRAHIQEDVKKAISSGQLINLLNALNNEVPLTKDQGDYQEAKTEILLIKSEIKEIELQINRLRDSSSICQPGVGGWLAHLWRRIRLTHAMRNGRTRIAQLHCRSEILVETWGSGILS